MDGIEGSARRQALTVKEFCEATGISRTSFYEALKRKQVSVLKFGRRTLVPAQAVSDFLNSLPKL